MRPIDADRFECIAYRGVPEGYSDSFDGGVLYMADLIDEAPTVSPDEVRGKGTWLRKEKVRHNLDGDGDYRYECSACGHSDEHNENVHVPFCWYCGAKMEVEGDA